MALSIPIISEFDGKGVDKAIKEFQQLEGAANKTGHIMEKAFLPAVAALTGLAAGAVLATKAAMEDAAQQAELARQLQTTTQATAAQVAAVEESISAFSRQTAIADDQLRPALANLVRATGSLELSQKAMSVTADLATAKNIDMETASVAVSKALAGQTTALVKLDPSLKGVIDSSSTADEIMQALEGSVGGAAEVFASTAEGGMKNFGIQLGELQESIGAAFLPVLEKLLPKLLDMAVFLQENTDLILIASGVIAGLSAMIVSYTVAVKLATVANTLFNLSLAANPIGLVVAAVIGLIAILTALYFKFDTVRVIVDKVFNVMAAGVKIAVGVVKTYLENMYGVFKTIFNGIATLWNSTIGGFGFEIPDWVPGIGGNSYTIPEMPTLGGGGSSTTTSSRGGAAREGGTGGFTSSPISMIEAALVGGGGGGGGGGAVAAAPMSPFMQDLSKQFMASTQTRESVLDRFSGTARDAMLERGGITVNVNGGLATSADIGRAVVNSIKAMNRVDGPAQIQVA
jgi:hypothetical protein